ncbi:hypothetical protein ACN47E_004404 [Coniothyrium glycines]
MPRSGPPFANPRIYFNWDARVFFAAHRPHWNTAQRNNTIQTIWFGSAAVRAHYETYFFTHQGTAATPGLPTPNHIPDIFFSAAQARAAENGGVQLDPPLPPVAPVQVAPLAPIVPAGPPTSLPERARNGYPFDFWPNEPWDPEFEDRSLGNTIAELRTVREARMDWMNTTPNRWPVVDETNFVGNMFLGAGSFGTAGLWVRIDAANNIQERFVVKEARPSHRSWRDPTEWRDQKPREIRIHEKLDNEAVRTEPNNLITHGGYRLCMSQRRYRIYLEYCPGGDLYHALEEHFPHWRYQAYCPSLDPMAMPRISEGFIWHVAKSLVSACQVLHYGQSGDIATPIDGWRPITHCDISLANILLVPDERPTVYPKVVLADFGMSFYELEGNQGTTQQGNPIEYVLDRQLENYAPEHQRINQNNPRVIDEKSDVWKIGSVLFHLIENGYEDVSKGPTRAMPGDVYGSTFEYVAGVHNDMGTMNIVLREDLDDIWPAHKYPSFHLYDTPLLALTARCLNWDPDDRPTLLEMRNTIEELFEIQPELRDNVEFGPLSFEEDPFQIGKPAPSRRI